MANCFGRLAHRVAFTLPSLVATPGPCPWRHLSGAPSIVSSHSVPCLVAAQAWPSATQTNFAPCYRAVLVDAAGTFLIPSEPVADVYLRYARPAGCELEENEVLQRFRRAYNTPWGASALRYVGDARPFWRYIVEESTGCRKPEVSEAIYEYYARAEAWHVTPGAVEALQRLKSAGVLLAVVSNFDTRLRPLLARLGVDALFDAVIVSAEVLAEKPNPVIFDAAVRALSTAAMSRGTPPITAAATAASTGLVAAASAAALSPPYPGLVPHAASASSAVSDYGPLVPGPPQILGAAAATPGFTPDFAPLSPEQVLHVGDDRRNDCWGARDAGLTAWQWGYDVRSWAEVADRVLLGSQVDEYYADLSYEAARA